MTTNTKLSKEDVDSILMQDGRGITLNSEYLGTNKNSTFRCVENHFWNTRLRNIISGGGCPHCKGQARLTTEIVNERLIKRGITIVSDYASALTKAEFLCASGHKWIARPNEVLRGSRCPFCPRSGKGGFNPDKPSYFYILKITPLDGIEFLKTGITKDSIRRIKEHSKWGSVEVIENILYKNGADALLREQKIKQVTTGKFISKDVMPNGWTETHPVELLNTLQKL
jgi:hypothetical protein